MGVAMLSLPATSDPYDGVPNREEAVDIAQRLLGATRVAHVCRAGEVAAQLRLPISAQERRLLVAAAFLHDIGYSGQLRRFGFHPLDGGWFLREQGFSDRLAVLVANHSHAWLHCPDPWLGELAVGFPREHSLLSDALVFADMSSAPDGQPIALEDRLADISQRHASPYLAVRLRMIRQSVARVQAHLDDDAGSRHQRVGQTVEGRKPAGRMGHGR